MSAWAAILWLLGVGSIGALAYLGVSVVRGLARLQPEIRRARKRARQQRAAEDVTAIGQEALVFRAQSGDAAAQTRVGLLYATGSSGFARDDTKALTWFKRAAASGFVEAQYYLGLAYERGRGVEQDVNQARAWYEQAAMDGNEAAQCNLGVLYLQGFGVQEDWVTAAYWFLKAAARGKKEAVSNLDWILERKDDAPEESATTLGKYERSAADGEPDSAFLIGWCNEYGFGVPQSPDEAVRWYTRAISLGHLFAHDALNRAAARAVTKHA